jgi:K+-transporting ATPase KdpF subunit
MTFELAAAAIVSIGILAYLIYSLIYPEHF